MIINNNNYMSIILDNLPNFQSRWDQHLQYWGIEEPGICLNLAELGHYIVDVLKDWQTPDTYIQQVFQLVEKLMVEGDKNISEATATCLLESILHSVNIETKRFVPYLGKESKKYIKAWDEFTGVKTDGLWEG